MSETRSAPSAGERLAKVIARAGLCSRRDAEGWIAAGRVAVNGKKVLTPAFNVLDRDAITVDGVPLARREGTRLWLYHKPAGLVVTEKDPEGRPTVFEAAERLGLPRVLSVGRLDLTTEGLLLLTNDGGLKRVLELPETGWLRRYRARAHGAITQDRLDGLAHGITVDGIHYGPIEAALEREQGSNVWLTLALREGKNREVRNVLESLGLTVNRLIRVSYGPFQLGDIPPGAVETVKSRVLRDQLGKKLAEAAGADFESDLPDPIGQRGDPRRPRTAPGSAHGHRTTRGDTGGRPDSRRAPRFAEDSNPPPPRRIHLEDGETLELRGRRGRPAGPSRRHTGDESGGQADSRASRPYRDARPPRGRDDDAPRRPRRDDDAPRARHGDDAPSRPPRAPRPEGAGAPRPRARWSEDGGSDSRPPRDRAADAPRRPRRDDDAPRARHGDDASSRPPRAPRPEGAGAPRPRARWSEDGDSGSRPPRPRAADAPRFPRPPRSDDGSPRPPRAPRPEGAGGPRPRARWSEDGAPGPRPPRPRAGDAPRPPRAPRSDDGAPRSRRDDASSRPPRGPRPEGAGGPRARWNDEGAPGSRPPRPQGAGPRPPRPSAERGGEPGARSARLRPLDATPRADSPRRGPSGPAAGKPPRRGPSSGPGGANRPPRPSGGPGKPGGLRPGGPARKPSGPRKPSGGPRPPHKR